MKAFKENKRENQGARPRITLSLGAAPQVIKSRKESASQRQFAWRLTRSLTVNTSEGLSTAFLLLDKQ